jgi:hypothetical protein
VDASELVAAMEVAWSAIQRWHPDVPAVVVTVGAGSIGVPVGALKLGHFAARRWVTNDSADSGGIAELFVGGEGLRRGADEVLATLLHEAAHGLADARGIKETSRQGRYHNARFKALGEELGLVITRAGAIGWSGTKLPPGTAEEYAVECAELGSALVAYRHPEGGVPLGPGGPGAGAGGKSPGGVGKGGVGKAPKNGVVLVCNCPKPRRIRASSAVVEQGSILCRVCDADFIPTQ